MGHSENKALSSHRESPQASNRTTRRRRKRRDTEPMGPARPPAMTPEQKRLYYEGPKPTLEQIRAISPSYGKGIREGYKASELSLKPKSWNDPRYRYAYNHFMIYKEDAEVEEDLLRDGIEIELTQAELDDPNLETILVGPGSQTVEKLIAFIGRFSGKGLKVKSTYDPSDGFAILLVTKKMKEAIRRKGFEIDMLELRPLGAII